MDIKSLVAFCDLADDLHFGRVADKHAMSASTLSRLVQRLEEEVGEALLARDNRNVSLTPAGARYLTFARLVLVEWQKLQADIARQSGQLQGTVSLYCSVTASHSLLSAVLARLSSRYAGIEIRVHTGDQAVSVERVLNGHEDIAIAARPEQPDARLNFSSLARSPLVLIAPAGQCSLSSKITAMRNEAWDWGALPWILPEQGIVRRRLDAWIKKQGFRPDVYAEVIGNEAIVSMVSLGLGVGLVPELVLTNSPAFDSIEPLIPLHELAVEFEAIEIGMCVLKRRLVEPLIEAVWTVATEASASAVE